MVWCVCVSPGGVNSPKVRDSEVRIFVALFSFEPATMSPNPDAAEEELPFSEGQIIKVRPRKAGSHPESCLLSLKSALRGSQHADLLKSDFITMVSFSRFTETKIQMGFTGESVAVAWALCRATWCLRSRWRTRRPGSSSCSRAICPQQPPWTNLVSQTAGKAIASRSRLPLLVPTDESLRKILRKLLMPSTVTLQPEPKIREKLKIVLLQSPTFQC